MTEMAFDALHAARRVMAAGIIIGANALMATILGILLTGDASL